MPLETGLEGSARLVVTEADTARALGSGNLDVLGTPRLIALCEDATVGAIAPALPAGSTSVGTRIEFEHIRPTPVGGEVTADAVLEEIDGLQLVFAVSAADSSGLIGTGKVTRAVVDIERFMAKLS